MSGAACDEHNSASLTVPLLILLAFAVGTPLRSQADKPLWSEIFRGSAAEERIFLRDSPSREFYEKRFAEGDRKICPKIFGV